MKQNKLYANATRGRAFSDEETQTDYSKCMPKKEVEGKNQIGAAGHYSGV